MIEGGILLVVALAQAEPAPAAAPPPADAASAPPPAAGAPAEPVEPVAVPAVGAVVAPAAPVAAPAAPSPEASALYLQALSAWQAGDPQRALVLAQAALAASPDGLEPAALLEGYALVRLGPRDIGLARLHDLGTTAADPGVRAAALRAWHRYADRADRSGPSIFGGSETAGRPTTGGLAIGTGGVLGFDVPIKGKYGVAGELSGYDTSAGTPVVEGPVIDVLATAHLPLGHSAWAARFGLGPSVWVAHGSAFGADVVPYLGLRGTAGIDVKTGRSFGLFLSVGAWEWPGLAVDLPNWQFGVDERFGLVVWFLPPPRDR